MAKEIKKEITFEKVFKIDVNSKTEKKGNLTYLSWAWGWAEFKKVYPEAKYSIKKFGENNLPYIKDKETGYMVFTEVEAGELIYEMWLPVMDFKNKAMLEPTMFDINKTIMRCLTKNLAMFGLGLYIYAGEDLPEIDQQEAEKKEKESKEKKEKMKTLANSKAYIFSAKDLKQLEEFKKRILGADGLDAKTKKLLEGFCKDKESILKKK